MPFIYTDPRLSYAGDFLHMMFSQPFEEYIASEEIVRALNLVLILHADHELGCSTTTVRIVGSSRANLFASCAAGICSLWGPVHGGATVAVVEMLEAIHRGEMTIDQAIAQAKDKTSGFRLKGFGHRIYKTFDPRARLLKSAADTLLAHLGVRDPLARRGPPARGAGPQGSVLHRPQALPQRRLLQRHPDAGDRHPAEHVHGHLRDRPDARLDRPLEGAGRRPEHPDRPPPPALHRPERDRVRADRER